MIKEQKIKLPITIIVKKEAQKRSLFQGYYPASLFKRLTELVQVTKDANVKFNCKIDAQGLVVVNLNAIISVDVRCERCLQYFVQKLTCDNIVTPVISFNKIDDLPEDYIPVLSDRFGEINIFDVVEDEFILALPLVTKHDLTQCAIKSSKQSFGVIIEGEEKPNPFAVLATLKETNNI